ncbi:MAG TPA: dual specificity protein phosphatase family protein [Terriglobales bacterium]|nr:dual specificity protein phosphatase family protein [Terriglobales bacterium]
MERTWLLGAHALLQNALGDPRKNNSYFGGRVASYIRGTGPDDWTGCLWAIPMAQNNCRMMVVARVLAFVSLVAGTQGSWCQAGKELPGLPNFGRVTDTLYRGAQPDPGGFRVLKEMGVGIVVNFRDDRREIAAEKRQVESLAIRYVSIPWNARDDPSSAQVVQFFELVRTNPKTKIFVHCRRGADRTGAMIAAYRIAVEHEAVTEAVSEMRQFHYDWFWRPHLQRYIESLPGLLQKDPQFRAYGSEP